MTEDQKALTSMLTSVALASVCIGAVSLLLGHSYWIGPLIVLGYWFARLGYEGLDE
jgi:hypothetical protein